MLIHDEGVSGIQPQPCHVIRHMKKRTVAVRLIHSEIIGDATPLRLPVQTSVIPV